MPDDDLRPFRLSVPDPVLKDLRRRLSTARFPDEPPLAPWSTGTSVAYCRNASSKYHQRKGAVQRP
jgi:hypothetical protein